VDGIVTVVYADIMEIIVEIHVCVLEYEKVRRAILYQEARRDKQVASDMYMASIV
jgi:hypothetical protein